MSTNPSNTITVGAVEFANFFRSGGTSDAWFLFTFFRILCEDGPGWTFGADHDVLTRLTEDGLFPGWDLQRYQNSIDNLEAIGVIGAAEDTAPTPSSWVLH